MAKKICRVCGKEYEACKNTVRNPNLTFRWQELACSKECGLEYFKKVSQARNVDTNTQPENNKTTTEIVEENIVEEDEEDFEHIFEDNIEENELWED